MLSHQHTPPIPLPVSVPPGHMMQQIVDENGILKHIIIGPNNSNEPMPKNQILTKNGAKLVPLNLTPASATGKFSSSSSSFKKKFSQSNGGHTESTAFKPSRYTNGLISAADPLLNGSGGLLNTNGLVYSSVCYLCCQDCPECVPNQLNSSSNSLFFNNELNYGRPTGYYAGGLSSLSASSKSAAAAAAATATAAAANSYPIRRSFNLSSSTNRTGSLASINHGYGKESGREKSKTSNSKSSNGCINNLNCNLNYSSSNYQPKGALLSSAKVCKQCPPPPLPPSDSSYTASYNQKYLYPAPPYSFPNSHPNQPNHLYQASPNKKYSYASTEPPKQSPTNRNRALSNSSRGGSQLISQAPLLNGNGFSSGPAHSTSKKESDCYSELIRYVNSNHISAFKSHKRIEHTKTHQTNGNLEKERTVSNSATASSSPISEHYDFSSEESEQINYKHTTLLSNPPTNYLNGYSNGYTNGYSPSNYPSPNYSSNHPNNSINSTTNSTSNDSKKTVRVKRTSNERPVPDRSEVLTKSAIEKCNNLKNELPNDERDDGYEGDEFEAKNCDSKCNEKVLLEAEATGGEQSVEVGSVEISKTCDDETNQTTVQDSDNRVNCELVHENCEESEKELRTGRPAEEKTRVESGKRILDENSNEIDQVDKNLSGSLVMPEIVESLVVDNGETLGYFEELNVEELNGSPNNAKNELASGGSEAVGSEESDQASKEAKQPIRPATRRKQEITRTVAFSLSYTKLTGNYVKLKWTVLNGSLYASAKDCQFMVEMIYSKREDGSQNLGQSSPSSKCSRIVYQGLSKSCKIQCLKELEEYSFRVKIVLSNDQQLISNLLTITTPELQIQPLNHFAPTKKRTSKHNLQLNLQQEILKQQQIIIEQKEKELQLKQSQFHSKPAASSNSLVVIFCAIGTLFKDNFAYLLLIFFSISAFSFANFISDLLN